MKSQLISIGRVACPLFIKVICAGVVLLVASTGQAQNLFVNSGNSIVEITPGGGKSIFAILDGPLQGMAFDSAGDLFVTVEHQTTPFLSGSVVKITPDGVRSTFATGSPNSDFGALAF